jgi:DNA-binding Lrp family transcriptional regulator
MSAAFLECERLMRIVADSYGISLDAMRRKDRCQEAVHGRRIVAMLLREAGYSFPEIGDAMHCDHSTVMRLVDGAVDKRGTKAFQAKADEKLAKARNAARAIKAGNVIAPSTAGRSGSSWRKGLAGIMFPPEPVDCERAQFNKVRELLANLPVEDRPLAWASYCKGAFPNSHRFQAAVMPR